MSLFLAFIVGVIFGVVLLGFIVYRYMFQIEIERQKLGALKYFSIKISTKNYGTPEDDQ